MTNDDLNKIRGVVKEEINDALEVALKPIKTTLAEHTQILEKHSKKLEEHGEKLDKLTEKVDVLWEQTAKLSVDVTEIKDTLNSHIKKIDKRVTTIENHLGLPVLSELAI